MDLIYPFAAVASESLGKTADKLNYTRNKIKPRELIFLLFATMTAGLLVSLIFMRPSFPVLSVSLAGLVACVVIISFGQNFFDYVGLSTRNLSLREPISNIQPVLASFMAYLFFPSEREIKYVLAIIAGVVILYLGNSSRKLSYRIDRGTVFLILGTVCSAALSNIYKLGLETIAPAYLLLFRTTGILLLMQLFYRPNLSGLRRSQAGLGIASGTIYIAGNLAQLYSIQNLGLNLTILILMLGPAIVYLASLLVLREKVQPRQIAASAALLVLVVWITYL